MNEVEQEQAILEIQSMNAEAKVAIARNEAYARLRDTADFKLVYLDGFCKEYPKELAIAITGNTGAYDTESLIESLKGIAEFNKYGFQIITTASAGEQALVANQVYLDELGKDEAEAE